MAKAKNDDLGVVADETEVDPGAVADETEGAQSTEGTETPTSSAKGERKAGKGAAGATTSTYDGISVMVTPGALIVQEDAHPSKWWVAEGLAGTEVKVLFLSWTNSFGQGKKVAMYDGDGSATLKYIKNNGSPKFGHREISGSPQV